MRVKEFVETYFDAWNHHNPKGIADHLSPNGFYMDVPEHAIRSRDELVVNLEGFFRQYRHRYELVSDVLATENTIAFQYRIFPQRDEAGRGKQNTYQGAEFINFNGDRAISITDYYDFPAVSPSGKYAKSGLTEEQLATYKRSLNQVMRTQKAYLNSDLCLPKLAELVGCSVNHLSQVINSEFGTSLFGYLNRYRIEYARKLLASRKYRDTAILDIAFSAGFNSNSTFYSSFKKLVGISPAEYRQQELNNRR